jgi:hypothetical protein
MACEDVALSGNAIVNDTDAEACPANSRAGLRKTVDVVDASVE